MYVLHDYLVMDFVCVSNVFNLAQGLPFPRLKSLLVEKSWVQILEGEFEKPYMERLYQFLSQEAAANIPIYPPPPKLFNMFNSCPFDKVKVVIIGQVNAFVSVWMYVSLQ
jgi:hypothetical protein